MKRSVGCGWRGRYLYVNDKQLARVVLDPGGEGQGPSLKVALPVGWYTSCTKVRCPRLWAVRLPLPYIPWSWCWRTGYARPVMAAYKASSLFWHRMDGRFGRRVSS